MCVSALFFLMYISVWSGEAFEIVPSRFFCFLPAFCSIPPSTLFCDVGVHGQCLLYVRIEITFFLFREGNKQKLKCFSYTRRERVYTSIIHIIGRRLDNKPSYHNRTVLHIGPLFKDFYLYFYFLYLFLYERALYMLCDSHLAVFSGMFYTHTHTTYK